MRMEECDTIFLLDYPIEVCLAGAKSCVGKKMDDLPWVEEKLDDKFKPIITSFSNEKLPQIYELLEKYKESKKLRFLKIEKKLIIYYLINFRIL